MAVRIRLMRVGKKKQPTYRVVVADARSPRDGRIIESIGKYVPRREPSLVDLDGDKALDWLRKGAQPTEQAQKLLAAAGVWARYEHEKGAPVKTKLARRGVVPGTEPPKPAGRPSKKAKARQDAASVTADTPPAGEPATEEPPADEPPTDGSPVEAGMTEQPNAEQPNAEEPAADDGGPEEHAQEEPAQ